VERILNHLPNLELLRPERVDPNTFRLGRMHALLGGETAEADLLVGVLIDPRAYRVFEVTRAPTFIATAHPLPDCDGLNCAAPAPSHDRIAGNLTLSGALRALAAEGEAAPLQARAALERLEAGP